MFYTRRTLIYRNEELKTSYYIASFDKRSEFNLFNAITHPNDMLLKGKCFSGVFTKKINFTDYDIKFYVNKEIKDYTFTKFISDILILDNPKFIAIYAERPPRPPRIKTQQEIDDENLSLMIASCSFSTAFL